MAFRGNVINPTWPMMILLQIGLLLIGICLHVGFDMPWKVALFPFYAPPLACVGSFLAFKFLHLI